MEQSPTSSSVNEVAINRCQKHTRNGRCRMSVSGSSSNFCADHSRPPSKARNSADLSTLLTAGVTEFKSAVPINDFLSRLLLHQAEGRIPPRRAAVMAYTCNLLLRTLPAIERELHPQSQEHQEPNTILMDIPSAVARRAEEARLSQDPESPFCNKTSRHGSHTTYVNSDSSSFSVPDPALSITKSPK